MHEHMLRHDMTEFNGSGIVAFEIHEIVIPGIDPGIIACN